MTGRSPAVLLFALAWLAACTDSPATPAPATPSGALLRLSDLPSGFASTTPDPPQESTSEPQSCGPGMDRLEVFPATGTGVREERVIFTDVLGVSRVQEILRTYDGGAEQPVAAARALVDACPSFLLTYDTGGQTEVRMSITGRTPTGFTAAVRARTADFSVYENLVVDRIGKSLIVLSHTGPTPPDTALTDRLAATARSRADAGS